MQYARETYFKKLQVELRPGTPVHHRSHNHQSALEAPDIPSAEPPETAPANLGRPPPENVPVSLFTAGFGSEVRWRLELGVADEYNIIDPNATRTSTVLIISCKNAFSERKL